MGGPGSGRKKSGGSKRAASAKGLKSNAVVKMKAQSGVVHETLRGGKVHALLIKQAKFKKMK